MKPHCHFPNCPRRDMEDGAELCPGHALLWRRCEFFHSNKPRAEAMAEWIEVLSVQGAEPKPTHTNGVAK